MIDALVQKIHLQSMVCCNGHYQSVFEKNTTAAVVVKSYLAHTWSKTESVWEVLASYRSTRCCMHSKISLSVHFVHVSRITRMCIELRYIQHRAE